MRFNSVIISSFFVSVVLAGGGLLAGTILTLQNGIMQSVVGTIHVPDIAGQKFGFAASVVVGIDLPGLCNNTATLRLEVVLKVDEKGPSYTVIYEYDNAVSSLDIDIKAGDEIKLIAFAHDMGGFVNVVNLNNNQNLTQSLNVAKSLCGKKAYWLVQGEDESVNLGTVTFENIEVGGSDFGTMEGKTVNMIAQDGKMLTSVTSVGANSFTVQWL